MYFVSIRGVVRSLLNIFFMPRYIGMFIMGICIKEYANKRIEKRSIILFVLSVCNLMVWSNQLTVIFTIGSALLIYLLSVYDFKINGNKIIIKIICYIAIISYPLYLCHQMIGYAIICYLQKMGLKSEWFIIIPMMFAIILVTIIHYVVEAPISKKLS